MPFVSQVNRFGGEASYCPLIAYRPDKDGTPILDSIVIAGVAESNPSPIARVSLSGSDSFVYLRTELLVPGNFDPKKSRLSSEQAERLRKHLVAQYNLKDLEGKIE
jgi:hypothetical protein